MSGQTPVTNMWDLRKPTLIRWWEDPEPLQDESSLPTTLTESPSARRAVSRWLSGYKRYEDKENKNDAVTTDDTGASKDGESTIVRVVDVDKEYDVEKKDSVDRNSIIKIKNDNIADKDINDRKDNRRNDENKKDNQCKCNKRRRQMKYEVRSRQCDRIIKNVVRPCMDIVPVSYIISSVSHLTDALCRLYDRWEVSSLASDPEFHHALFALVGRIKWLTKDLHATSGTCDQMVLLVREYDECQIEYMRLMEELNDNEENSSDDSMKMYFSKAAKNNLFENSVDKIA